MLNLKDFEKVADDGKTVTMAHKKGHQIKVILKALRPIEREQMKRLKMAEGGRVQKFSDTEDTVKADDSNSSGSSNSPDAAPDKSITINVGTPSQQPQAALAQPAQVPQPPSPSVPAPASVSTSQNT